MTRTPKTIRIAGGGLAGLALGIGLRKRGVPVILFEPHPWPRHRVCGEFMAGRGRAILERLLGGLPEEARGGLRRVYFHCGDSGALRWALPEPALGWSRHAMDAALAETFTGLGGVVERRRIAATELREPGMADATGRPPVPRSPWSGVSIHLREASSTPGGTDLDLYFGKGAYAGLSPVEEGRMNLGALIHREYLAGMGRRENRSGLAEAFRRAGLTALARRLEESEPVEGSFASVAGIQFGEEGVDGEFIRLGDAADPVPPFTGNGMSIALEAAERTAHPLSEYAFGQREWPETVRKVQRLLRPLRQRVRRANRLQPILLAPTGQRVLLRLHALRLLPLGLLHRLTH